MSTEPTHDARMNFRLSRRIKERVERAAQLSGQSVSDFAASTLAREADEVIARQQTITLADADRDFFLRMLDEDAEPSEKSLAAAARYREGRRKGSEYHW